MHYILHEAKPNTQILGQERLVPDDGLEPPTC